MQEVKRVTKPKDHEDVNKDHTTPHEVFMNNHKKLAKEAEKSMKEIATSCTVVGALIVIIMFATIFTVPDGNNGDTGLPTLLTRRSTRFLFRAYFIIYE
ncbi:ankyrin repeat-containing protein [Pyrus ussuriensis x Pyrus communis]|uniref:Ankyrin repeat-containing protein n=1 Tax=Pyrus ussuriensis x Pyrus communis TaxID=2448454 RepID=A0A5N5GEG3_9ROSA|nr:ankyrin repeat-containing protein [Pyrus ussuriensis x Pyrus communis]